ncbi:B3 domain-containing protein Os01g0234100-like [Rutidosis leptorrhynchoides]|uniref:B3 domain-containing protein Os01g0234100-like n=1 Tax=Rutidosis leptorrhynchoides TaxID=125765 RepID=UPI003A996CAB
MVRAGEIQATLGNEYPSFCKTMIRSHVTNGFWMSLPMPFAKSFLPKQESPIVVEDENGEEHMLKYIAYRYGLSGGWRSFAVGHKLHEGDVLIFQLVGPCRFKIYINRTHTPNVVDSEILLLEDTEHKEQLTPGKRGKTESKSKRSKSTDTMSNGRKSKTNAKPKARTSLPLTMVKKKQKQSEPPPQLSSQLMEHSAVFSEVQDASAQPIEELKTFKDFHIMVNKWCIDSELSEQIRLDYYNLCVAKNEILHDGVLDGVYYKLVAGMIGETVSIANMIKNCKPTTKKERFDVWDSSLKSFEIMGMKVGFLRNRVRALATLAFESEEAKRCAEAKKEKKRNLQEIRVLEAKVAELYERNLKIDGFLGGFKEKVEGYEVEFQKKVSEPW